MRFKGRISGGIKVIFPWAKENKTLCRTSKGTTYFAGDGGCLYFTPKNSEYTDFLDPKGIYELSFKFIEGSSQDREVLDEILDTVRLGENTTVPPRRILSFLRMVERTILDPEKR